MIDELTLFCGCYDLGSVATPEHATPTSVVLRAVDKRAANVGTAQEVAIKAMMNEEQFIRGGGCGPSNLVRHNFPYLLNSNFNQCTKLVRSI